MALFQWTEQRVSIDFDLNDDHASIKKLLQRLEPVQRAVRGTIWRVNFDGCERMSAFAAAVLWAEFLHGKAAGHVPLMNPPDFPCNLGHAMEKNGLTNCLLGQRQPDGLVLGTSVAPHQVALGNWGARTPILQLAEACTQATLDQLDSVGNAVNEVLDNVRDHAQSSIGAVMAARYGNGKLRVAIVDRGRGIGTTLRPHYVQQIETTQDALENVVVGHYSAKSRANNQGLGISNVWAGVVTELKGQLLIITEDAWAYNRQSGKARIETSGINFPGTGVFFTVPLADRKDRSNGR